jgi:hypothetical protein
MPHNGPSDSASPDAMVSDQSERKKKNADAQAAFRARRANYIATLEETGAPTVLARAIVFPALLLTSVCPPL